MSEFVTILISSSKSLLNSEVINDSLLFALGFFSAPSLVNICTSITVPDTLDGTLKEVSLISEAFSPNIALRSFSSGDNCDSPFGVTLPTKISPASTFAPTYTMPFSSNFESADSLTPGISEVISSMPSFVSRVIHVNSCICMLVSLSS